MTRTYVKSDGTRCEARFSVVTHYWNNQPNTYTGSIQFSDNGQRLFTYHVPVQRTNKNDALMDCADHLHDGQFGEWLKKN